MNDIIEKWINENFLSDVEGNISAKKLRTAFIKTLTESDFASKNANNLSDLQILEWKNILNINNDELIIKINSIEELRNTTGKFDGQIIELLGYYNPGEYNLFYKWFSGNVPDDGGKYINTGSGTWEAIFENSVNIKYYGAVNSDEVDSYEQIQKVIDLYDSIFIPEGTYITTQSIYIPNNKTIFGLGKNTSIIKTPFRKKAKNYANNSLDYKKALIAESNVSLTKGIYSSLTSKFTKKLDLINGHNRFYIGGGIKGYYDSDRHTNLNHPLYYPDPGAGNKGKTVWDKWFKELKEIENKGNWVGLTGRENYGLGLFKSTSKAKLIHTVNTLDPAYNVEVAGSRIHSGNRHVSIRSLQIQTNSSDRGKDSGINFNYSTAYLKSNLENYDSSCLGINITDVLMLDIGGDGFSVYRGVNNNIINCISQRCAGRGFRINGVTSTTIQGCYANGCLEAGYDFRGVHYSTLMGNAADSCSKAYNFNNCSSITLTSCGAEASKALYDDELMTNEENPYPIYPGRAFNVKDSDGILFLNCYASTTRFTNPSTEETDVLPLSTRHFRIDNSTNITVNNPILKSYRRWRTAPLRDISNNKVEDRRVWEFQDRLVDAIFEVRGDNSSIVLLNNSKGKDIISGNADRTINIDLFDPGLVPNPDGHNTAFKTIRGLDGNGGWLDSINNKIDILNFESLYPLKNKTGKWDKYWAWRESLIPLRIYNDITLNNLESLQNGEFGYKDIIKDSIINWKTVSIENMSKFSLNLNRDREKTSWIDGDKKYYTYTALNYYKNSDESDEEEVVDNSTLTFIPISGNINARSYKSESDGFRSIYNSSEYEGNNVASAAHGFIGNKRPDSNNFNPITAHYLPMKRNLIPEGDYPLEVFVDSDGYNLLKFYATENGIIGRGSGVDNKRMLSFSATARGKITKLTSDGSATNTQLANRINNIIDRMRAHGLIMDGDI